MANKDFCNTLVSVSDSFIFTGMLFCDLKANLWEVIMKHILPTVLFLFFFVAVPAFADEGESVYDRVMRTGTIRCAYYVEPPNTFRDPNTGVLSGIVPDLVESLGKEWGLKIEWSTELDLSTMFEGLNTGKYDAICSSIWNLPEFAPHGDFTVPFLYTPIGIYVRADDARFDQDLMKLNDPAVKIAGIDGEGSYEMVSVDFFPKATGAMLPQSSNIGELFLNVANKKADAALAVLPLFREYEHTNPGVLKNLVEDKPLVVLANSIVVKSGEAHFKDMWNTSLRAYIAGGKLDQIIDRWERKENSFRHPAKPYAAEQ